MVAAAYILVVLIPLLNPRHIRRLPGDFMYTGLLYSLPLAAVAGASAFGWMLAYLRGPDTVAEYISYYAGTDPRMIMLLLVALFVIVGDFIDAVPAIIIFMFVGVPFHRAMIRSFPLYIVFFLTIAFTVLFPQVVLWLPKFFLPQSVGCFPSPTGAGYICPP
jgi:TRAP-type C4-dicarboxylate transport system permease large subunit